MGPVHLGHPPARDEVRDLIAIGEDTLLGDGFH